MDLLKFKQRLAEGLMLFGIPFSTIRKIRRPSQSVKPSPELTTPNYRKN